MTDQRMSGRPVEQSMQASTRTPRGGSDSIPGYLDLHALAMLAGSSHDARAQEHRPTEPAALAAEIRRLRRTGLTPRDIAVALRIGLGQVLEALESRA
jgi:hypothetical protein